MKIQTSFEILFVTVMNFKSVKISTREGTGHQYVGGWWGGAMVLGKLPVPGRSTVWFIVGQGLTALTVGAGGVVWTFLLSSIFLFLPLFGRRPDID